MPPSAASRRRDQISPRWGRKQTATLPSLQREAQLPSQRREEEEDRERKKGPLFPLVVLARTVAAAFLAGLAEAEESHARTERGGRFQGVRLRGQIMYA